jgi:peptide deformylase
MSETGLKIKKFPDPVLRKKAKQVKKVSAEHAALLSKMARLMYESKGVGLAAPQVGINEAFIVVDAGSGLYKLVNPKILKKEGIQVNDEGCLSVPGVYIKVKRAKKIWVSALDETSKPVKFEAHDLLACALQHEIDHLYGRLIVDYASFFKKMTMGIKKANAAR